MTFVFFFKSKKQLYIYVLVYEFIKLVCIMIFLSIYLIKDEFILKEKKNVLSEFTLKYTFVRKNYEAETRSLFIQV